MIWLVFLTSVVIGMLFQFTRYSLWRRKYCQLMPGSKPWFFDILADAKDLIVYNKSGDKYSIHHHIMKLMVERSEIYREKKIYCFWATYFPFIFLLKPDAIQEAMKSKKSLEKSWIYCMLRPLVGSSFFICPYGEWKLRRKLLSPSFHSDMLRDYLSVFNEQSQKLMRSFQSEIKKEVTFIEESIYMCTLNTICETILGVQLDAMGDEGSNYMTSFKRVSEICFSRMYKVLQWPNWIFRLTPTYRDMKFHTRVMRNFLTKIMDQKKLQYLNGNKDKSKGKKKALIDVLLQQHFENQVLRDEDIREDIDVLIIGGHETTATTVAWTLYLLGLYPDIQKQVHEELDKVFGEDGERYASERDLNDLKYLDSVLKETQRLYPAATFWARQVSEDINICGYTLPKGSSFVLPAMILHRDPEVFPEPDKFDPDRFSAENSVNIPEYAYIPFSVGQRNCIGQRFGVLEMKTIVSTILRSYRVESLDGRDVVLPVMQGFIRSSVPIRVRIRTRRNQ